MASDPAPPPTRRFEWGELVLAIAVGIFGALVIWQTTQIRLTPAYSKVGPRVIPYIVGVGLVVIALWLAWQTLTGHGMAVGDDTEDADPTLPTDWRTVGLLALCLLVYLALLESAGFVVASALLFAGAAFAIGSRRIVRDLALGVAIGLILYLGFTHGLGLRLPAGVLGGVL
jgi:putative tricarboxylic transport membrane protein